MESGPKREYIFSRMLVSVNPGWIQLMWMPSLAYSNAVARVRFNTAPLERE
jgi:hypothetical protein